MADFEFDAEKLCDACQGSGQIERDSYAYYDPNAMPVIETCGYCDGEGTYTVHVRPIDVDDLDDAFEPIAALKSTAAKEGG